MLTKAFVKAEESLKYSKAIQQFLNELKENQEFLQQNMGECDEEKIFE